MTSLEKNLKFLIYIGVAILLCIPFIVTDSLFFPYITGKAYTFRIVAEIIIALYLILAIYNPSYRPKNNWIFFTFLLFLISTFYSNLMGINPTASFWSNYERMEGWVTIAHLFGLFVALGSILRDKKEWIWIFNASIAASLVMVFTAFGQVFDQGFNFRVDTSLGNSTYLGIYMLMNAFLSLFMLLREKINFASWQTWVYSIAFILQSVIVFQTGTRGSMLGLLGGVILIGLVIAIFNKEQKFFRKTALILIAIVAVFVSSIFIFKDSNLVQDNVALKRITTISINEGTAKARINNWQMAIEGFKERPVFGWGQSNFSYVFDKHYLPEHHGNEVWFDRVHNIFFDWLIAGGVVGLLLYLSIWVSSLWYLFKNKSLELNEKAVMLGLLAGYFFHNLFVFDQIVSYIYFVFFLAFIYSQTKNKDLEMFEKDISDSAKNYSIFAVIIVSIYLMYSLNYPSLAANKELLEALKVVRQNEAGELEFYHENGIQGNIESFQSALNRDTFADPEITERILTNSGQILRIENVENEIKQQYVNFGANQMENILREFPNNSRHHYVYGTFFAQIGQPQLAEEHLLKAIELSPTKQAIRIPLIKVYAGTGQAEKAIQLAKETYELDTSKKDIWKEYILTASRFDSVLVNQLIDEAIANGNASWAEEFFQENVVANPGSFNNIKSLALFYLKIQDYEAASETLDRATELFPENIAQINTIRAEIPQE